MHYQLFLSLRVLRPLRGKISLLYSNIAGTKSTSFNLLNMENNNKQNKWDKLLQNIAIPRKSGSDGEKKVRGYILDTWNSFRENSKNDKINVRDLKFSYPKSTHKILKGMFIFTLCWILFLNYQFIVLEIKKPLSYLSFLFPVLILIGLMAGTRWNSFIEGFYKRKEKEMIETANIEASIDSGASKTIVFTAHYDSKSQTIDILSRMIFVGYAAAGSGLIALYSLYYKFFLEKQIKLMPFQEQLTYMQINIIFMVSTWLVIMVLTILYFTGSHNKSKGALDNASGVVVLTRLLEHFSSNPPENLNLRFVATGAEEDGLIGMVKYLDEMKEKLSRDNTVFINLDTIGGSGEIKVINRYGIPPVTTSGKISKEIVKKAKALNIKAKTIYSPAGAGYDSIPSSHRGYESVTLACCKLFGELSNIHSEHDTPDLVKTESLEKVYKVCVEVVKNVIPTITHNKPGSRKKSGTNTNKN